MVFFIDTPHGSVDTFLKYINVKINNCVLLGDFNLDLLNFESHPDIDSFLSTLGSFYFQPQILQPTRIRNHSATLIDNIFFNSLEDFVISGNLCYDLTDHLPNFLIVSKLSSLPASTKVLDKEILIRDIQSIDWNGLIIFILSYLRLLTYMYLSSNYLSSIKAMDNLSNYDLYEN